MHHLADTNTCGHHAVSPPYQSTTTAGWMKAFAGLAGYCCIVNDVVIYDNDEAQHAGHVWQFLQHCAEKITLNTDKWQFAQAKVNLAGFALSADDYRIDQSITEAVSNFPTPTNQTDLWAFFGLVNQLSASSHCY